MGVFEMVVLVVLIATIGKVADSFASRPRAGPDAVLRQRLGELERQLAANDLRVVQAEGKVAQLEEKLEFVEQLLEAPADRERLPESGSRS